MIVTSLCALTTLEYMILTYDYHCLVEKQKKGKQKRERWRKQPPEPEGDTTNDDEVQRDNTPIMFT
jgi:hypothetical protein